MVTAIVMGPNRNRLVFMARDRATFERTEVSEELKR
jgi:hypothetical protein